MKSPVISPWLRWSSARGCNGLTHTARSPACYQSLVPDTFDWHQGPPAGLDAHVRLFDSYAVSETSGPVVSRLHEAVAALTASDYGSYRVLEINSLWSPRHWGAPSSFRDVTRTARFF